jgi:glycosyltransferase involved in cell wall biosynthesis
MVDSAMGNDYTFYLCSGMKAVGIDIYLVVPEDREVGFKINFLLVNLSPTKSSSVSKSDKLIRYINYLIKLYRYIKKNKFDAVHFQFLRRIEAESIFFLFLRLTGTNLVYTVHDVSPLKKNKLNSLLNILIYKSAKVLIVHSAKNKQMLLDRVSLNPEKIKIVPHGNFNHYVSAEPLTKNDARKYFGLNSEEKVLLFFGFIKEYKGLDILLEAAAISSKSIGNLTLIIAGAAQSKTLVESYNKMISELPKDVKVIYHSEFIDRDKVAFYFLASDVLVLPYRIISHSGVLHLAYSFGRAIIGTRVGDFEEFIEDGKSGILTNSNDSAGVAKAIIRFYSDSENVDKMCSYARNLNDTKFSWTNITLSMKEIYQQLKS